jgi:DNA-directed RNA polymerase subunit RPC12/RpoP
MPDPGPDDVLELRCPECNKKVLVKKRDADKEMLVRCPDGHEIPLVKAI